jgi:hypothetical protein
MHATTSEREIGNEDVEDRIARGNPQPGLSVNTD